MHKRLPDSPLPWSLAIIILHANTAFYVNGNQRNRANPDD